MVTKERTMVTIKEAERIYKEANGDVEIATKKLRSLPKRQPKPPAPEGGISLREAGRKYGLHHTTLLKWVKKGILPVLKRTPNWLYVDEATIRKIKENGGITSVTN